MPTAGPSDHLDVPLRAIANPQRRAILRLVWNAERTAGDIAAATGLSAPATSQHLKVLLEAGLVIVRRDATSRFYTLDEEGARLVRAFLDDFWGDRLQNLRSNVEASATESAAERAG